MSTKLDFRNGNKVRGNQLFEPQPVAKTPAGAGYQHVHGPHGNGSQGIAREGGKPKNAGPVPIAYGQKRVEDRMDLLSGKTRHPLLPGARRPLDDEPMQKKWDGAGNVPIHEGMHNLGGLPNDKPRNLTTDAKAGSKHLAIAGELGRAGHNHVGHVKFGTLPDNKRDLSK